MSFYEESKCLLEQIKIFQCGQSQHRAKSLIRYRHQAVQRDVVRQGWVILSLSKVLKEHVAFSDTQILGIEDLWKQISGGQTITLNKAIGNNGPKLVERTKNNS